MGLYGLAQGGILLASIGHVLLLVARRVRGKGPGIFVAASAPAIAPGHTRGAVVGNPLGRSLLVLLGTLFALSLAWIGLVAVLGTFPTSYLGRVGIVLSRWTLLALCLSFLRRKRARGTRRTCTMARGSCGGPSTGARRTRCLAAGGLPSAGRTALAFGFGRGRGLDPTKRARGTGGTRARFLAGPCILTGGTRVAYAATHGGLGESRGTALARVRACRTRLRLVRARGTAQRDGTVRLAVVPNRTVCVGGARAGVRVVVEAPPPRRVCGFAASAFVLAGRAVRAGAALAAATSTPTRLVLPGAAPGVPIEFTVVIAPGTAPPTAVLCSWVHGGDPPDGVVRGGLVVLHVDQTDHETEEGTEVQRCLGALEHCHPPPHQHLYPHRHLHIYI